MSSRKASEENVQNVNPALFLATAYDKASEAWTTCSPNFTVCRSFQICLMLISLMLAK